MDGNRTGPQIAVGVARIVWGAILAVAPGPVHAVAQVRFPGQDGGVWVRAFGIRDIGLGAGALHTDPALRRASMRAGLVMDIADIGATLVAGRAGLPRQAVVTGSLLASSAIAAAAVGEIRSLRERSGR